MQRLTRTLRQWALPFCGAFFSILALSACNGASDDSDSDTTDTYTLAMSYKLYENGSCTTTTSELGFATDSQFCAVAKLTANGSNVSGALISFSNTTASLTPDTKLTNSDGEAEVVVSSDDGSQGAGSIQASYTQDDDETITASRNFEFVDSSVDNTTEAVTLSASIIKDSATISRFKVDEAVQLQAQLLDAQNQGIAGVQVNFSAGSATLLPSSALTNDAGIAQVSYTPDESELGANSLNVSLTYADNDYQVNSLYEVLTADAVDDNDSTIQLGSYNSEGSFVDGVLATTLNPVDGEYTISAGGSFGITATLIAIDQAGAITRLETPSSVSFTSDCVADSQASIDSPVTTLSGSASTTFQNTSCSGNSDRDDQIVASTVVGNQTLSAQLPFVLARQTLANLSFVSAEPSVIRVKGSGGTDSSESSLVTFQVTSADGQPAAQQTVTFTLDTIVGGITFANGESSTEGVSNSEGLVSARILAGSVPTPVRVVATAIDGDTGETISSQSEQLTINTGLPQQFGFTLSTSEFNPEAGDYNGETVTITAYASDSFANPAPDDTTINFTTEGGQIEPTCLTVNGRCSVEWTSAEPRVSDHRITILAYALGHETFFDTNGNNIFDADDGGAIALGCLDSDGQPVACSANGMNIDTYHSAGFIDLDDAFRDDNENGNYDSGERYFNTAASSTYTAADTLFNGPQCEGDLCGADQAATTYIRKALVMTMSGSSADFALWQDGSKYYDDSDATNELDTLPQLASEATLSFNLQVFDSAQQIMPFGTQISVAATEGELTVDDFTVPNQNKTGGSTLSFSLKNDNEEATEATSTVTVTVTTPKNVISTFSFNLVLQGA